MDMPVVLQGPAEGTILLLLRNTDTFAEQASSDGSAFCGKVSVLPVGATNGRGFILHEKDPAGNEFPAGPSCF